MKLVRKKLSLNFQSGQTLLVTLLIMVVGLTVALAVIARSITSVKISTQEEESQRAFYAAEAGLEEALLPGVTGPLSGVVGGANYLVTMAGTGGGIDPFVFPEIIEKDNTQTVWLVGHNDDGTIKAPGVEGEGRYDIQNPIDVCWQGTGGATPAMEVIIIHQRTGGNKQYGVARGAYDPDDLRRPSNSFSQVTSSAGGQCGSFQYRQRIDFGDTAPSGFGLSPSQQRVVAVRLRPVYNDARIAAQAVGSSQLPPQGQNIESLGTVGSAQRKLKVFRAYPSLPPIFDFVIFSGTSLTK